MARRSFLEPNGTLLQQPSGVRRHRASAATPSGSIGRTKREDRSIGLNRRRWAAIAPRRIPRRRRLAKRGQIGLSGAQAHGPVRRREMAKRQRARGAGEASVPPAPLSSERERLEAAVASLSGLNADQLRLQWRNHLGGISPAHLPGWLLARVLGLSHPGRGIRGSRSGDLAASAREEGRSPRARTSSSLCDPRTDNARGRRAQVRSSPRPRMERRQCREPTRRCRGVVISQTTIEIELGSKLSGEHPNVFVKGGNRGIGQGLCAGLADRATVRDRLMSIDATIPGAKIAIREDARAERARSEWRLLVDSPSWPCRPGTSTICALRPSTAAGLEGSDVARPLLCAKSVNLMSRQRRKDWHSVRKGACVWIFRRREGAARQTLSPGARVDPGLRRR